MSDSIVVCPACGHEQHRGDHILGTLGKLLWFRCRACGTDFNDGQEEEE